MQNGLKMYLDEHKGVFGGAKVTLIVEDDQAKPDTGVTKANKLTLSGQGAHAGRRRAGDRGLRARAGRTAEKTLYIGSIATADDLAQRDLKSIPYFIRTGWAVAAASRSANGPASRATSGSSPIAADYAFGHESAGGFQKAFEDCGGKVVQKIWPPIGTKDFGPYIPTIKADIDAIFALMVGPMVLQFPKQLRAVGYKKPIIGGGTSYDEFMLPFMGDEVIGDVSALHVQRCARHAEERRVREEISHHLRQGAVVLLGDQLHHRADDRRGDEEDQRRRVRARAVHQAMRRQARRDSRAGRASTICATR